MSAPSEYLYTEPGCVVPVLSRLSRPFSGAAERSSDVVYRQGNTSSNGGRAYAVGYVPPDPAHPDSCTILRLPPIGALASVHDTCSRYPYGDV
jgi:hypothetical protein